MSATPKQRKLIEDLFEVGAPIPAHQHSDQPATESMFASVEAADAYIKSTITCCVKKLPQTP